MDHENQIAPRDSVLDPKEPAVELRAPERSRKHAEQGEHAEKGSLRSMWELLMQLRVLLPYLSSLIPLLDRGLAKIAPDLSEVRKSIGEVQTGSRDLGIQVKNQTLRLDEIEARLGRLSETAEQSQQQNRDLASSIHLLTRRVQILIVLTGLLLLLVIVMAALQLAHLGH
jgi:septal ring factor EnvC (AmiA/AmiB activator)